MLEAIAEVEAFMKKKCRVIVNDIAACIGITHDQHSRFFMAFCSSKKFKEVMGQGSEADGARAVTPIYSKYLSFFVEVYSWDPKGQEHSC